MYTEIPVVPQCRAELVGLTGERLCIGGFPCDEQGVHRVVGIVAPLHPGPRRGFVRPGWRHCEGGAASAGVSKDVEMQNWSHICGQR